MFKKFFIAIMCISAFILGSTCVNAATVVDITDEPVDEFDPESNTDSNTSEKDDIVINDSVAPDIVVNNTELQKETYKEQSNILNISKMAEGSAIYGVVIDTQCYLSLQKEGKEHDSIMTECSSYDISRIKDFHTSNFENNKQWFVKTHEELFNAEELFTWFGEFFSGWFE